MQVFIQVVKKNVNIIYMSNSIILVFNDNNIDGLHHNIINNQNHISHVLTPNTPSKDDNELSVEDGKKIIRITRNQLISFDTFNSSIGTVKKIKLLEYLKIN